MVVPTATSRKCTKHRNTAAASQEAGSLTVANHKADKVDTSMSTGIDHED